MKDEKINMKTGNSINMVSEKEKVKDIVKIINLQKLKKSPYQGRLFEITGEDDDQTSVKQLEELTQSIETTGLMQPVIVRPVEDSYEIIDGQRRVMAMRKLGRGQIKAIVKNCTEREAQIMSVVGNLQRKNLTTIEQAVTYKKLLDAGIFKDKRELSKAIGKDESYIGDLLGTLNMDSRIVDDLAKKNLVKDLRILRAIRRSDKVNEEGKSEKQWDLYRKVALKKLNRKKLNELIRQPAVTSVVKDWIMKPTTRGLTFRIAFGKITPEQKEKLIKSIEDRLSEIQNNLK